jgi:predicted ArsR family transcriptional regulator
MKVIGINKTQMVRDLLKAQPNLSAKQIAEAVDCHITIVHEQRRNALKGKQMVSRKQNRPAKKKMGRPSKVQIVSDGIAEASKIMADLATMYGLLITIYEGKVLINKSDIDYECTPTDVPAVLGTLAYLNSFKKD